MFTGLAGCSVGPRINCGARKRKHQSESQYKQGKEKSMEKENILLRRKGTINKRFLWSTKGFEFWTSADLKLL